MTYNGVPIGRVGAVSTDGGDPVRALVRLDIDPKYLDLLPANVQTSIQATTVFGNKYVAFTSPEHPSPQRVSSSTPIDVTAVTTEFNTLFETITAISEQVDPVKLNQTLSATAQALTGLGSAFGQSLADGNTILDDVNPRMPALRRDIAALADLGERYAAAGPDLFDGLAHAARSAGTFNSQRGHLDAALVARSASPGPVRDILERGGPYLQRGAQDLIPTSKLFDKYQGAVVLHHPQLPRRRARLLSRRSAGTTDIRSKARGPCRASAWEIRTCIRTTSRASMPRAGPRANPVVGSRSPPTCGLRRIW